MKINQRLFDHYGIDTNKDLKIEKKCPRPFDTILIDKQGSCYACECQSWLPQSIGNLQIQSLKQIIAGEDREHVQSSISDGTYRYCNESQCSYLKQGHNFNWQKDRALQLRLAIDDSCNLRCPSCRKNMIFHKDGKEFRLGLKLANRVNRWLETQDDTVQVHVGSDGDPFASHIYRHFMEGTPRKENIKYSLLTNALMFNDFHGRIPHVIDNLLELGVSMDGASRETYEKLRLGGKWVKINDNLARICALRQKHGFTFSLHFVVQKENYHEMEDIIHLGERYGVDRIWLNNIEDWNVIKDWARQDIFDPRHPEHSRFIGHLEKIKPYINRSKKIVPIVEATKLYRANKWVALS